MEFFASPLDKGIGFFGYDQKYITGVQIRVKLQKVFGESPPNPPFTWGYTIPPIPSGGTGASTL